MGCAILAVGMWQARAGQESGANKRSGADATDLIKHGNYLDKEVAHCSRCHTAPDSEGQPDRSRLLQGATLGFAPKQKAKSWADKAPDITANGLAGKWSEEEMIKFLTTGVNPTARSLPWTSPRMVSAQKRV